MASVKCPPIDLGMNLYEFNKQAMNTMTPLDAIMKLKAINQMAEGVKKFQESNPAQYKYWMLLSNERRDYTVFNFNNNIWTIKDFTKEIRECLDNRGNLLDVEQQEDGNFEIWLRDTVTKENVVYYFFNYTKAVIEIK